MIIPKSKFANADSLDREKMIGSSVDRKEMEIDENNCQNSNSKAMSSSVILGSAVQPLLKGDRVLSVTAYGGMGLFIRRLPSEVKYVIGTVVLNKEWKDVKYSLGIRWETGKMEALPEKREHISFGDRLFVLDRACVTPGSRVFSVGCPETEGTVLAKRHLATGTWTFNPDCIFEDIDVGRLERDTHGSAFKDIKILYHGWIGLTYGFKSRVHLKAEGTDFAFRLILPGDYSENLYVGKQLRLGFRLLRVAEFQCESSGHSNNWLLNFLRFYNTFVVITHIELEELEVYWLGKASNPAAELTPYQQPEAPESVIPYENLLDVEYLLGQEYIHIAPKSVWKLLPPSNGEVDQPNTITKDAWSTKWLKLVGWDNWEYSPANALEEIDVELIKKDFMNNQLSMNIMYSRTVVDVLWADGSISTVNCDKVIPIHVGSVWSQLEKFCHLGTIVGDRFDRGTEGKYGIVTSIGEELTATVKWITPSTNDGVKIVTTRASLYDLEEKHEYDYLSNIDQCPLVSLWCPQGGDQTQIGVVLGINCGTGKVLVRNSKAFRESYWPHEIQHYKCDVWMCPKENRWASWYEHITPPPGLTQVSPESPDFVDINNVKVYLFKVPKMKLEVFDEVPVDNIFAKEEFVPRLRETNYRRCVDNEVVEMEKRLPEGMWIEYYTSRGDILSAIVKGPKQTLFEDLLFIFDIYLMEDFPTSEPYLNFRSFGVTLYPGHFCKTGAVFLPQDTRLGEEEFSFSHILNVLLEIKDFMATPLQRIHAKDSSTNVTGTRGEDSGELYKFILLACLDYTLALLRKPPKNWCSVIFRHYQDALPRIIERFKNEKGQITLNEPATASVSNEKGEGDVPEGESEITKIPWSEAYTKTVHSRIFELEQLYAVLNSK